ncbi:hypothetical protein N7470_008761 [Penicillium chermesinum]|nr:hypothetical protein N7470_008761 [Penicillium chermesinum]
MADYCYPQASSTGSPWCPENALYDQSFSMQDLARAFPRPRHTRVMKPRSAGNSPSSAVRRRAVGNSNTMYGLPSQYQSSLQAAILASAAQSQRPTSWHPSSTRSRGISHPPYAAGPLPENYGVDQINDSSLNLLSVYANDNTSAYSIPEGPAMSPEGYVPFYLDNQEATAPLPTPALSIPSSQVESMAWDTVPTPADYSMQPTTSDGWSLDMLSMANIPLRKPPVPAMSQFDEVPAQATKNEKEEELVGMGLYNQPDGSFSHSQQGLLGKGLKLEDSFCPSDEEKDDEVEEEPEAAPHMAPEQAPVQQMSLPKQPSKQALNLLHRSFFFDTDDQLDQQTMTAAQPFVNLNQSCMSYGYGWI